MEKRLIAVLSNVPNYVYIGKTELTDQDLANLIEIRGVMKLEDARSISAMFVPVKDKDGNDQVATQYKISTIVPCRKAIPLYMTPTSYYWPDQTDTYEATVKELDKMAKFEAGEAVEEAEEEG